MTPQDSSEKKNEAVAGNGRNPLLIVGGFIILGLALTLIIFGGNLFGRRDEGANTAETGSSVLEQVPAFEPVSTNSIELPIGGGLLEVGDLAYDFVLNDVNGNSVQLSDYAGQPVIINFWATWCGPCRVEMPELEAAYQTHQEERLVILALDQQEPAEAVASFFEELGLNFTAVLDTEGTISELYGVASVLPTTFFINGAGEVTAIHRGPMVQSQIDDYLADTLSVTN